MPGSEIRTATSWRTVSRFYRRPPGVGWWLALATIPLLLALIGYGITDRSKISLNEPDIAGPTLTAPAGPEVSAVLPTVTAPELSFAPLSILRNGNVVTLNGNLPDAATHTALLDKLTGAFGPGVRLVDNLTLKPGIAVPDTSGIAALFKSGLNLPDLKFRLDRDTVTLIGTAASDQQKAAVGASARSAWPTTTIIDQIVVRGPAPGPSPPPVPSPAGDCATLQSDITALMRTPATFTTNGYTLSPNTRQQLGQVAQKITRCHDARIAVNGYTDNTGNDAINNPLSANRARSIADFLVSQGVPADHVTSKGFGSADPVASNATQDGRSQNRRVAIVVN